MKESLRNGFRDLPSAHYSDAFFSYNNPSHSLVFDAFCGIGGNAIQFSKFTQGFVIGMDSSFQCLLKVQHNSQVYGVSSQLDCVLADTTRLPFRECNDFFDITFLSPPWGGPKYCKKTIISLENIIHLGFQMLEKHLAKTIIYYLPRNLQLLDLNYLFEKNLVCFLEGYLNRSGRFHFYHSASNRTVGCQIEKKTVSTETLASLWYPLKQNSWSWNLSVVTVWIGALANVAFNLFHSPICHPCISNVNNVSRKCFFISFWKTIENSLLQILGVSGTLPHRTVYRRHTQVNYIIRASPCHVTRVYLKKCCEKKFRRLHQIKSYKIVKKKIEKKFFHTLLKKYLSIVFAVQINTLWCFVNKTEGATLHRIVLQLECIKQFRNQLVSQLFNFLNELSKKSS
ncbi:uncharacterized protein LOC128883137 isoform X2 [Hylaeus volcanicus]|uniref:uncharacterized protein LOC128883137 isoform X2 n=1 Tax=Hylaeus volcanicus TaxID=313075 RepID=UPI0023B79C25|nr:uncharacterized protein LOC128883137 isoform X2 [Hylaeus volcanicus]